MFSAECVFYAGKQSVGIEFQILFFEIESEVEPNAVADFVFQIFKLWFVLSGSSESNGECGRNDHQTFHKNGIFPCGFAFIRAPREVPR